MSRGRLVQWPASVGWSAGRKRSGLTAASGPPTSSAATPANGTVRPSRTARVFAWLMRMRKIQVLSDERPSNAQRPWITPTQVSCTTSSATARFET